MFLGGVEEIGANSCYLYLDGTGIIIDAGLHPKIRDKNCFPVIDAIENHPVDYLILTHAHTDHIGAVPYVLKKYPHLKLIMTRATRDLVEIMLRDTAKILKSKAASELPSDMLSLYKPETLDLINSILEAYKYNEKISITGRAGRSETNVWLYASGHILGSASVRIENRSKSIFHTGDINFENQRIISAAKPPAIHVDSLITECTNAAADLPDYKSEMKRLAKFINEIVNENGSILIPAFALGKTQETLKILYDLMRKGSIPVLPIYTGGIGQRISIIYDKYCYSVPMMNPGFEVSDIPQIRIRYDELSSGDYFKEPGIVVTSNGMMQQGTVSYKLALKWFRLKNFGIAIVGYQDDNSPGWQLQRSEIDKEFEYGDKKVKRSCRLDTFRFTSHSSLSGIVDYISEVKPNQVFAVHGSEDSCENMCLSVQTVLPDCGTVIPILGKEYIL